MFDVFHALNGTRIAVLDFRPAWEKHRARATLAVFAAAALLTLLALLPAVLFFRASARGTGHSH